MEIWSEYQSRGLWGLWRAHFGASASPFEVCVEIDGRQQVASVGKAGVALVREATLPEVFSWSSGCGLLLSIHSAAPVSPDASGAWELLLHLEKVGFDLRPTFFPFMPGSVGLFSALNELLILPPAVLLLNGQPGSGKRFMLQSLCQLRAGRLPDLDSAPFTRVEHEQGAIWVVPEVAMLEIKEQQELWKHARSGDALWVASVYDVAMLCDKKIVHSSLAALLEPHKLLLPAMAKRDPAELQALSQYWQAFYGRRPDAAAANLAFLKKQVLGGAGLSVESILEEGRGLRGVVAEFEKEAIRKAHARVGRSQHKISRLLKVSRGSLQHKLRKYQLESYTSPDADNEA